MKRNQFTIGRVWSMDPLVERLLTRYGELFDEVGMIQTEMSELAKKVIQKKVTLLKEQGRPEARIITWGVEVDPGTLDVGVRFYAKGVSVGKANAKSKQFYIQLEQGFTKNTSLSSHLHRWLSIHVMPDLRKVMGKKVGYEVFVEGAFRSPGYRSKQ